MSNKIRKNSKQIMGEPKRLWTNT